MSSNRRASIVVVATFLVAWPWARAYGDTVGTGSFTVDVDLSGGVFPFPFTGSVTFDNMDRDVFGHTINLGTAVGSVTVHGSIDSVNATSPTSGSFSVSDLHDNIDGTHLNGQASGSCSTPSPMSRWTSSQSSPARTPAQRRWSSRRPIRAPSMLEG